MKFGVENRNVNFASPLIERNVATHSLTQCSMIAATRGPTQVQSAYHSQTSRAKLAYSSSEAWLSPMLLPNTPFRSTAAAYSVPCPSVASTKQNAPVMSSATSSEGTKSFCAATFLREAPSKSPTKQQRSHEKFSKRR